MNDEQWQSKAKEANNSTLLLENEKTPSTVQVGACDETQQQRSKSDRTSSISLLFEDCDYYVIYLSARTTRVDVRVHGRRPHDVMIVRFLKVGALSRAEDPTIPSIFRARLTIARCTCTVIFGFVKTVFYNSLDCSCRSGSPTHTSMSCTCRAPNLTGGVRESSVTGI